MFKFDLPAGQLAKVEAKLRAQFNVVMSDSKLLTDMGKTVTERIRYQARITKPLNDTDDFKPLQRSTIEKRRYLAKYNVTQATYEATRANVTLTGAFLNSLGFDITGVGQVTLKFIGQHPGYKTKSGRTKNPPSNEELFGYLKKLEFVTLSKNGVLRYRNLQKQLSTLVSAAIRRSFKS